MKTSFKNCVSDFPLAFEILCKLPSDNCWSDSCITIEKMYLIVQLTQSVLTFFTI